MCVPPKTTTTSSCQRQAYLKTEKVHWKTFAYICMYVCLHIGYLNFLTSSICLGIFFLRFSNAMGVGGGGCLGVWVCGTYTTLVLSFPPMILLYCWPYGSTLNANESDERLSSTSELMVKCGASRSLTIWEVLSRPSHSHSHSPTPFIQLDASARYICIKLPTRMNIRLGLFLAVLLMARDCLTDEAKFCVSRHCNCRYIVLWILVEHVLRPGRCICMYIHIYIARATLSTSNDSHSCRSPRWLTFQINSLPPPTQRKVKQKSGCIFEAKNKWGVANFCFVICAGVAQFNCQLAIGTRTQRK